MRQRILSTILLYGMPLVCLAYSTTAHGTCNPNPYDGLYQNTSFVISCLAEGDPRISLSGGEWEDAWLDDPAYAYYDERYETYRSAYWVPHLPWAGYANNTTIFITPDSGVSSVSVGPVWGGFNQIYNSGKVGTISAYGSDNYVENNGFATTIEGGEGSTLVNNAYIGSYDKNIIIYRDDTFEGVTFSAHMESYEYGMRALESSDLFNLGMIQMTYAGATKGMAIADESTATNESTGSIYVAGADSIGMYGAGNNIGVILHNDGFITTQGDFSEGMSVMGDAIMENFGVINAGGDGSRGMVLAGHAGQMQNSGSITSNGIGNEGMSATYSPVGASYLTTISMTNDGSIFLEGDEAEGMHVGGFSGAAIVNSGSLEVNGSNAEGISASGSATSIRNAAAGTVTVNGLGVLGIALSGTGEINNEGAVWVTGDDSAGVSATGDVVMVTNASTGSVNVRGDGSVGLGVYGLGDLFNEHDVTVTGDGSAGLYVYGSATITNSGSVAIDGTGSGAIGGDSRGYIDIVSYGSAYTFGADSAGIFIRGEGAGTGAITNYGDVHVTGVNGFGIGVTADNAQVTNFSTGSITVTEVASTGMGVVGDHARMTNAGTITAESSSSIGMGLLGNDSVLMLNNGTIATTGVDGYGMAADGLNHKMQNSGTITTSEDGAYGMLYGMYSTAYGGELWNYGAISTSGDGADGINGQAFAAVFRNLGDISTTGSGAAGIFVDGDVNSVINGAILGGAGTITTTELASSGIQVTGNNTTVRNNATIETSGEYSHGINVTGDNAIVSNLHSIEATGQFSGGIRVSGDAASILNSGDIDSLGHGISVTGDGAAGKVIVNAGSIMANGPATSGVHLTGDALNFLNTRDIDATGAGGTGVYAEGDGITVDNGAYIFARGVAAFAGVQMNTIDSQTSTLINSGEIGSSGTAVLGGAGRDTLINSGTITGDIDLRDGNDQLILRNGSTIAGVAYGGVDDLTSVNVSTGTYTDQHMGDVLVADVSGSINISGGGIVGFEKLIKTGSGRTGVSGSLSIDDQVIVDDGLLDFSAGSVLDTFAVEIGASGALNFSGDMLNGIVRNDGNFEVTGAGNKVVNGDVDNNGWMEVESSDLQVNGASSTNDGVIKITNASISWNGEFDNYGLYSSDPSDNYFRDLIIHGSGYLDGGLGDNFFVSGNFLNMSTQYDLWNTVDAYLGFTGTGYHDFLLADWIEPSDFSWGTMELADGGSLNLLGSANTGLYVDNLILGAGSSLNLNGFNLYYTSLTNIGGSYVGGNLYQVASASQVPEPSTLLLVASGCGSLVGFKLVRRKKKAQLS